MDLYQPLYVPRSLVVPELFAPPRPVAYSGALGATKPAAPVAAATPASANYPMIPQQARLAREQAKSAQAGEGQGVSNPYSAAGARQELARRMGLGASVAAAAAAQLGDFFQYVVEMPVTLPRQKSALLPIVGKDVEATRVSIYNEGTQPKFPLLGLRLKNTSGLHLVQGPVTVFEGGTYASDARIADLQPGEERLISYAVDRVRRPRAAPPPGKCDGPVGAVAGREGVASRGSNGGLAAAGPDKLAGAGPGGAGDVFPYSAGRGGPAVCHGPREGQPRGPVSAPASGRPDRP
jgi:hypothetical protein